MKYDEISEKLNDVAMNGVAEEEYGSCQEEGFWAALIITHDLYGIIQEDDQGFIDYETHDSEEDVRKQWEDMVNRWQGIFHPEEVWA